MVNKVGEAVWRCQSKSLKSTSNFHSSCDRVCVPVYTVYTALRVSTQAASSTWMQACEIERENKKEHAKRYSVHEALKYQ